MALSPSVRSPRLRLLVVVIGVLFASLACVPGPPPANVASLSSPAWQDEMLRQVNEFRASQGVAPLALCATLSAAAMGHANDMTTRQYYDHKSPEQTTPAQRITNAGYTWTAIAENIAGGQRDVTQVMTAWLSSTGHRTNLANPAYTHLGVGMANGTSPWPTYWVQNFGAGGTC